MPRKNTHRDLCMITAQWLQSQDWCDIVSWEISYNDGIVDAIGLTSPMASTRTKIVAVECKRTNSDLIADLKASKYMKYEYGSTHCYLAATKEALKYKLSHKEVFDYLASYRFPIYWGVILLPTYGRKSPQVLRAARPFGTVIPGHQLDLTIRIAKSFGQRLLSKQSPLTE